MSLHGALAGPLHWSRSLRLRLLTITLVGVAVAMVLAGLVLSGLFRDHVQRQFELSVRQQLDQVTARLEFDAQGQPVVATEGLSDPRWLKPYSGLYWQVDAMAPDGRSRVGVLRSRSLWDTSLPLQADMLANGEVHVHELAGPQGAPVLVLERALQVNASHRSVDASDSGQLPGGGLPGTAPTGGNERWRLSVAADMQAAHAATAQFTRVLTVSLAVLLVLLVAAAWAQVSVGLYPLKVLQRGLQEVQQARATQVEGVFPAEVQPLVDDFNAVLRRNAEVVARARTQAGNLAHALKTPLTVLEQAARVPRQAPAGGDDRKDGAFNGSELSVLVQEQVQLARRHIDWHLARSRLAASAHLPGQRTAVEPVVDGLVRVMNKVHAQRGVDIQVTIAQTPVFFAGETQDLQEMLGNLLDNACKWARSAVCVQARLDGTTGPPLRLVITVEDDGPGLGAVQRAQALARGVRLDETVPGTGLGLAIVQELAALYGGKVDLEPADLGGLRVVLTLPAAPGPA